MIQSPLAEDVIDCLPRGKPHGKEAPLDAALGNVKDDVDYQTTVSGRPAEFAGWGEHGFQNGPLGIREAGLVNGVLHRLTGASALVEAVPAQSIVNYKEAIV